MSSQPPTKKAPPTVRERTQNFLLYGFILSIALHVLLGPLLRFNRTPEAPEKVETVKIDRMPTPPPTPKPTPPPTPPPPTPPPTTPPKATPEPPKPKQIKINTLKTNSKSTGQSSESANTHTEGSTNGVPEGSATGAPTTVPVVATPAPPPPPTPPPPTPTPPPTCAVPNAEARVVNAVNPETPPLAQQQGISGEVTITVSLDENSKLVSANVSKTPSALLNNAALASARQSTFKTKIVNCKPVAESYRFIVEFASQ